MQRSRRKNEREVPKSWPSPRPLSRPVSIAKHSAQYGPTGRTSLPRRRRAAGGSRIKKLDLVKSRKARRVAVAAGCTRRGGQQEWLDKGAGGDVNFMAATRGSSLLAVGLGLAAAANVHAQPMTGRADRPMQV